MSVHRMSVYTKSVRRCLFASTPHVAQSHVIAGVDDAMQYQGSGVTPGKNVDCAAISTLFVTICWPLWTEGEEKK